MSHHTLYYVKPLLLYVATFKFTRDDLSESVLRRNIGDKYGGGLDLVNPNIRLTMLNLGLVGRELREDTFFRNKNDDAHEHVERVLDIVSLLNILGVSHDIVMLRVFPITLTGAAKRWVDRLPPGIVDSWDLLEKAFIQRYCLLSKTAKQLEEICNFKQEGDETLYKAWECSSSDEIVAIVNKLENLGRDMKKLKEASREAHEKIIQGVETKVKTSVNEVEGRTNNGKFEECKTNCTEDGLPLCTPFYYSRKEIEYFSANSGFSDNEKQETNNLGMAEALAALKATLKKKREEPKKENEDEDDLEWILDYLKPISYDGFIDLDDEAYNKRRCRLLGMTYEEPAPIIIKKSKVTRYTIGSGETYTKVLPTKKWNSRSPRLVFVW
nr:hypothetical protein [Tanacetum cinerariifolium]